MPFSIMEMFFRKISVYVFFLTFFYGAMIYGSADALTHCDQAVPMGARGTETLMVGGSPTAWLEVTAPAHGLLAVQVDDPRAMLGAWGHSCDARAEAELDERTVGRSPQHQILRVEPFSTWLFRIGDPRGLNLPGALHVRTVFFEQLATKGGEDEEVIELDGLTVPPGGAAASLPGLMCDDHHIGRSFACARGAEDRRKLAGRLDGPADVETYRIRLGDGSAGLWRLRARLGGRPFGPGDAPGLELFDRRGVALDGDPSAGLVVASGIYFVRVSAMGLVDKLGDDGDGTPFTLALDAERW